MRFRDGPAHAHALRFGREKRLEHAGELVGRNAGPVWEIEVSAKSSLRWVHTVMWRAATGIDDIASIALTIRFRMTCWSWIRSPLIGSDAG